ncbi:MAG: AbrB/MazE/SpoVT family DNA-binding domain-containing protein [Clostridiales bacterium]|jgi:transcriptional pleiotropic regulator of transition state genes|nr:AbrB/MazE/SpoVT family DNA-binding domain-containing protein [Clostridiales bacterium]
MKSLGIVRRIDHVGRIVLPKELRRMFDLEDNEDAVEIFVDGDKIILKKYEPSCIFCDSASDISDFMGKRVCKSCAEKIASSK